MHVHPHVHLPCHHIRPRRPVRGAVITAAIALLAALAAIGGQTVHARSQRTQPAPTAETASTASAPLRVEIRNGVSGVVATIRGLDADATNSIGIFDLDGLVISGALLDHDVTRFDNLPAGEYHIEVSSEGPVEQVNDALISSSVVLRSEPFSLTTRGPISVQAE